VSVADMELPPGVDVVYLDEWPDVPFLIPAWDQAMRPYVQESGEWEPGLANFAASQIGRRPRIVVAGGHVGLSAFQLWRARPHAREISVFEPDGVCAGLLALNTRRWRGAPVRLWPFALGAAAELLELSSNPTNSADNRLWRAPSELAGGGGDPAGWRRQPVLSMPLDLVRDVAPLDLLFLDAQGWEPEILRGARQTIARWQPLLMFEWWPRALAERGIDAHAELDWIERELGMRVSVVPGASVVSHRDLSGEVEVRELSDLLLEDVEPIAYAQLVGTPR
jgi:FkbM family methyltransferase